MNCKTLFAGIILGAVVGVVTTLSVVAENVKAPPRETPSPAFTYKMPNVKGKSLKAYVVNYPPGGKSISHKHGKAFVVAYVLSGAIRSQLAGSKAGVYKAGESWSEPPGAHHVLSENVSEKDSAKLLAIFVADDSQKNLVNWDK